MNTRDEILIAIGRIEGKLEAYASLSQRVSTLERWQAWLKGGWAALPQCLRGCFAVHPGRGERCCNLSLNISSGLRRCCTGFFSRQSPLCLNLPATAVRSTCGRIVFRIRWRGTLLQF